MLFGLFEIKQLRKKNVLFKLYLQTGLQKNRDMECLNIFSQNFPLNFYDENYSTLYLCNDLICKISNLIKKMLIQLSCKNAFTNETLLELLYKQQKQKIKFSALYFLGYSYRFSKVFCYITSSNQWLKTKVSQKELLCTSLDYTE